MRFYLDSGGSATASGTTDTSSPTASGSTNATCAANKTFASATDVNTGTDQVTVTGHGYSTGFGVTVSGTLPGGLSASCLYFIRAVDANTLTFHRTSADAQANTNIIDLTSTGTGTQTIANLTVFCGGSPDLSSLVGQGGHCRLTTTGLSHIFTFDDAHGFTDGDFVQFLNTVPGGTVGDAWYCVKALTSTTIRVYQTVAQAVAGGASLVNVSGTVNDGHGMYRQFTHQAIYLASSSVSGQKIFRVRYVDNTNKFVVVYNVNVTGLGGGSDWAIGGRATAARCTDIIGIMNWNDECIFNTDISGAINATYNRFIGVGGAGRFIGKAGARRVWTNTGNGTLITAGNSGSSNIWLQNLELQSQGTGGVAATSIANGQTIQFIDCRLTDAGTTGVGDGTAGGGSTFAFYRCELTNLTGICINGSTTYLWCYGCYFHDNAERFIAMTNSVMSLVDCIFERGTHASNGMINFTSTAFANIFAYNSTFYRGDSSGIKWTALAGGAGALFSIGCIFKDSGNAATEFNLEWPNRVQVTSRNSAYDIEGGRSGLKYPSDFPLDSTDITNIDGGGGGFIDPDNGTASLRNFGLNSTSPGYGLTYTLPGSATLITYNMGAVQPDFATDTTLLNIANKRANWQ